MTVEALLNGIRPKVGDKDKKKFTDERLLELINEGLEDLGKKANVNKKTLTLPILPYQRKITIPDENFLRLQRVRQNNQDIGKYTFSEMDKSFGRWEEKIGSRIEGIVYDLQNPKILTLYPLISETSTTYEALNNNTDGTILIDIPNVQSDSVYGLITSIDLEDIVIPENVYDANELAGYEPILSLSDNFITLEFTYFAKPDLLDTSLTDLSVEVDIDESYKNTLIYYVAGVALLDDNRTEAVTRGQVFLQKYIKELVKDTSRTADSYQGMDYPEIPYRTGF